MLMWIYRRRGGWVALRQSFQQSAVSWTISNWIKIIQTGKHKYNIEVMSEQVLPVFPGGSKGCEPAHIHTHTHTHTQPQIMQCNNLSNQWNYHFFTFCFVEKHIIACRLFPLGSSLFLYENQLNLICVLSYGNFPHQKLYHGFLMFLEASAGTSLSAISGRSGTKESGRPGGSTRRSHAPNSLGTPKPFMMRQSMA